MLSDSVHLPLSDCPQVGANAVSQNLRAVYDKNGKKMVSTESGSNVEDPASFFANVFGGERFMDYVCPTSGLYFRVLLTLSLCRLERSR